MNIFFAPAVFCGSALLSAFLVEVIRRWALRGERYDLPNERSSHIIPTPRGGGLAIVIVTLTGWLLFNFFVRHQFGAYVWAYPIGGALIAAVSWMDDLRGLSNSVRFAVHSIAAMLAIVVYGYLSGITLPGFIYAPWPSDAPTFLVPAGITFTFLWIVWLTNAYNFMDGIDGIAGLQALVAGLSWPVLVLVLEGAYGNGEPWHLYTENFDCICALGWLIAGSSLGFLFHNRPPARIFMGDVGSAFLGYSFALAPFLLSGDFDYDWMRHTGIIFLFWPAVLFVWPFLFDTIFTFVRRAIKRENVFKAHRSHLFQRLVIAGCSHRFVTLLYGALAVEGAFFAFLWASFRPTPAYYVWLPLLGSMLGLWLFTRWCEKRAKRANIDLISETQN